MRRLLAAVAVLTASAYALVTAYEVEPVRAEWSGIADGPGGVSQTVTCNFDSLRKVDLFVGEPGAGGGYAGAQAAPFDLEVRDEATGELVAYRRGVVPAGGHRWLRFAEPTTVGRFVKGKSYRFSFTRSEPGGINYYYRDDDPYPHGGISGDAGPDGRDLALRAYGAMDTIPATFFGTHPYFPFGGGTWGCSQDTWKARAIEAGMRQARFHIAWTWIDSALHDTWRFAGLDTQFVHYTDPEVGCELYANLYSSTLGTSTRFDSIRLNPAPGAPDTFWNVHCPPRNLFEPVGSGSNHWARFVEKTVRHYDSLSHSLGVDSIRAWEIWNEPNIIAECWYRSNTGDYGRPGDSLSDFQMCSLYVRLCAVADSVIKDPVFGGHPENRVLVGSLAGCEVVDPAKEMVMGKTWLRWMYEIADNQYGGPFWDGVAFHYYPNPLHPISPYFVHRLDADVDTLRAIMRASGDFGELWITETGWPVWAHAVNEQEQANAVAEVFTTVMSLSTRPGGGYDRCTWYSFRDSRSSPFGLTDTLMIERKPSFYAFRHLTSVLPGRRSTGRVRLGDERDGRLFIHEFEDPQTEQRLWVGWTNRRESFQPAESISVRLPALTDRLSLAELPYADREPKPGRPAVGADGRFTLTLTNRPVFISEVGRAARPDLVVDSVWTVPGQVTVGRPCTLYVRFSNLGSRATRHSGSERNAHLRTGARFYAGDRLLGERDHSSAVGVGRAVTLGLPWTPEAVGPVLIRVAVNEERPYVEHSTDGNAGYRRFAILPDPAEDSGR